MDIWIKRRKIPIEDYLADERNLLAARVEREASFRPKRSIKGGSLEGEAGGARGESMVECSRPIPAQAPIVPGVRQVN